jgi:leucyl-tRNA---protein transferase
MTHPKSDLPALPSLVVVHDSSQPCPYLNHQIARLPLQWPLGSLTSTELDSLLESGFRRSGMFLYRTQCPACESCEPTRIDVHTFVWSNSFRRVLRRGDQALETRVTPCEYSPERLQLFNDHNQLRGLDVRKQGPADADEYRSFLVDSCADSRELSYWQGDTLLGVAITDFAENSLSAVYCYYNPHETRLSIGTYSILKQIELARDSGRRWLYLGFYVAGNRHLNYKARFIPQQRRQDGRWVDADVLPM